jgi:AcrR family transcriptional regulator
MDEIADELGITKPTLYVHSGSKADILEGIFERVLREGDEMLARAEAMPVASDRLRAMILNWTGAATSNNQAFYRVFAAHLPDLSRPAARYFLRWSAEVVDRVRTMIIDGQRAEMIRSDVEPTVLAYSVLAVPNWTARWFRPDGRLTAEDIANQQWSLLWAGMATPDSRVEYATVEPKQSRRNQRRTRADVSQSSSRT